MFQQRDLVWIYLIVENFPPKYKTKLMPRVDGPFEVADSINHNAHKVNFQWDFGVLATFNVVDWSP